MDNNPNPRIIRAQSKAQEQDLVQDLKIETWSSIHMVGNTRQKLQNLRTLPLFIGYEPLHNSYTPNTTTNSLRDDN